MHPHLVSRIDNNRRHSTGVYSGKPPNCNAAIEKCENERIEPYRRAHEDVLCMGGGGGVFTMTLLCVVDYLISYDAGSCYLVEGYTKQSVSSCGL